MKDIVVVDDSETLRDQLTELLQGAGYNVIQACDGKDGLAKIRANPQVRLILCDVNMPEMDGISMCQALSKDETSNKIPILMLTTEASAELKLAGKGAGVLAWMLKPVNEDKLLNAVKKITGA